MLKHISEYIPDAVKHFKDQSIEPLPPFVDPGIYSAFKLGEIHNTETAKNMLELANIARECGAKLTERDLEIERNAFNAAQRRKK